MIIPKRACTIWPSFTQNFRFVKLDINFDKLCSTNITEKGMVWCGETGHFYTEVPESPIFGGGGGGGRLGLVMPWPSCKLKTKKRRRKIRSLLPAGNDQLDYISLFIITIYIACYTAPQRIL